MTHFHEFMIDINQRVQTQMPSKTVWGRIYVGQRGKQQKEVYNQPEKLKN